MFMNVTLDNIIFSIQKAGGISVVWYEHVKRLLQDPNFKPQFIEYANALNNVFRKELPISNEDIINKWSVALKYWKYLDIYGNGSEPYIFHSSVYRIDHNKSALNVVTVHDFAYERYVKGYRQVINSFSKFGSIRKADAVICISESTKRDLLTYVPGVDESKIKIVYNGVGSDYFPMTQIQHTIDIPFDDKEFVLFVGNRRDYKNFKAALVTCKELGLPLVIAGGEVFTENETAELNSYLPQSRYYITGKISNSELNELYNRAGVLLYPSQFEGFGIPVLEAQRAGCPVVCLSLSSIPEVMGISDYCLIDTSFDSITDAVRILFNDSDSRNKEIERGFTNAARFSWDKTYQGTTEVYKTLL